MYRHFGLWARYVVGLTPQFFPEGDGGGADAEALKKAQFERDTAKAQADKLAKEIEELKKSLPSAEQLERFKQLEADAAKAEEERKRKAGEWDTLKNDMIKAHQDEKKQLVDLHQKEIKKLTEQGSYFEELIRDKEIGLSFAGAMVDKSPLFGDEKALTVFTPDIAVNAFRPYVTVEYDEVDGRKVPVVKVKGPDGKVVIDSSGKPKPFGPALLEVIERLPSRDRILRGSGKTGSGSSGGGNKGGAAGEIDWGHLTPEQMRDPEIIAASKRRTANAGGIVQGSAWETPVKK